MTIDEQLEQLAHLQYHRQVDVVDGVMAQVERHPYLRPVHRTRTLRTATTAVAAAAALLLGVSLFMPYLRGFDEESMAGTIAQLGDYSSWNTVEDLADDPYTYFYTDEETTNH